MMEKIVNVAKKLEKDSFYSREDIRNLVSRLEGGSVLDFRGAGFIGPSPAHELLVAMKASGIRIINLSRELRLMLKTQNDVRKVGLDLRNLD